MTTGSVRDEEASLSEPQCDALMWPQDGAAGNTETDAGMELMTRIYCQYNVCVRACPARLTPSNV